MDEWRFDIRRLRVVGSSGHGFHYYSTACTFHEQLDIFGRDAATGRMDDLAVSYASCTDQQARHGRIPDEATGETEGGVAPASHEAAGRPICWLPFDASVRIVLF